MLPHLGQDPHRRTDLEYEHVSLKGLAKTALELLSLCAAVAMESWPGRLRPSSTGNDGQD